MILLLALVNALLSVPTLLGLLLGRIPPEALHGTPSWYPTFMGIDSAVIAASAVGLFLHRRWGFLLMVLGYFAFVLALVVARQSFICIALIQFPLLALGGRNWKALR